MEDSIRAHHRGGRVPAQVGCTLILLFTLEGPYCVLRQLCKAISVEDACQQCEQLLRRQATRPYMTKLPVTTPNGGKQVTYCIDIDILAW